MCLLVTRAPTSSLASASLHELDRLCEFFELIGEKSQTATNNLVQCSFDCVKYQILRIDAPQEVVQKLRRQAHDAANNAQSADRSHPLSTELDRLGGKTHLISSGHSGMVSVPSPASSNTSSTQSNCIGTPGPSTAATPPFDITANCSPIPPDQIHPTIISDMRSFEEFSMTGPDGDQIMSIPTSFNFDLAQAFPLPQERQQPPDYATLEEIQRFFGDDFFGATATAASASAAVLPPYMLAPPNMEPELNMLPVNVPVLDATWQSFVEQLGF
ncbi:hypothetical protein PHLCEN_2v12087 [Hermanssonia centrifuga]|uniref:Uncharacterized protein n=1 Tax=Hermanssonia centrifuga TaxID=98765 RepID=A0A2R6NI36_9APHY|nr:hypothetical protein PHLCEN_2v12087 [Hermanssonia centrifuga]